MNGWFAEIVVPCLFLTFLAVVFTSHVVEEAGRMQRPKVYSVSSQPCKILLSDCVFHRCLYFYRGAFGLFSFLSQLHILSCCPFPAMKHWVHSETKYHYHFSAHPANFSFRVCVYFSSIVIPICSFGSIIKVSCDRGSST